MERLEGRARPPGGPKEDPPADGPPGTRALTVRKRLGRVAPAWVKPGAMFFVTVCGEEPAPDKDLRRLVGDWKRFTSERTGIRWQKNFFDHRLRSDESWDEKAAYIRNNPVRAGLLPEGQTWPYVVENW